MKKLQTIASVICILLVALSADAQPVLKTKTIKLPTNSSLTWYLRAIKPVKPAGSGSAGTVLGTRSNGDNSVQIGIGLPQASQPFAANGAARQSTAGDQVCTIQPMKVDFLTTENFNLFTPDNTIIPGKFFNINSVVTNSFAAFNGPQRKAYQLGMSIFNPGNTNNMLNVTELTRSPLPEVQSTLLAPNYGATIPTDGVMDMVKINSSMELKASFESSRGIFLPLAELGIPLDISASMDASTSGQTSTALSYYMVNLYQPMYTINVLTNNDQLFADANAYKNCTDAAYVESVTYGRRVVIIIGSASSETSVKAALSASLGATITGTEAAGIRFGGDNSAQADATLRTVAVKFHAKVYGGDATLGNGIFGNILDFKTAFKRYITSRSAGTFSAQTAALPLHYTLRRISDDAVLSVRSVGSFDDLIGCNTSKYKVEVLYKGFKVNSVVEAPFDDKEDIWGSLKMANANVNGNNRSINMVIKSIAKDNAVSEKAGGTDGDDISVKVLDGLTTTQVTNTTLNFSESIFDWEPLHNPDYKPASSGELKFNLNSKASEISALQPGQSKTYDNDIKLEESSIGGTSKITLITKIKVTKQ